MNRTKRPPMSRRAILGGLAALPVLTVRSFAAAPQPPSREFLRSPPPITAADQVLNVMDFEALARDALPPAHFGFLATGADDDLTVTRNHEAFAHYEIRSRRFVDVSHIDTARSVLGAAWSHPDLPVGGLEPAGLSSRCGTRYRARCPDALDAANALACGLYTDRAGHRGARCTSMAAAVCDR